MLNARDAIEGLCVRTLGVVGRRPWLSCGGRSAGWQETKQKDPRGRSETTQEVVLAAAVETYGPGQVRPPCG